MKSAKMTENNEITISEEKRNAIHDKLHEISERLLTSIETIKKYPPTSTN
jgi:hypothetical protein